MIATMPAKEGPPVKADPCFNPEEMLPKKLTYYRYPGSLTRGRCGGTTGGPCWCRVDCAITRIG